MLSFFVLRRHSLYVRVVLTITRTYNISGLAASGCLVADHFISTKDLPYIYCYNTICLAQLDRFPHGVPLSGRTKHRVAIGKFIRLTNNDRSHRGCRVAGLLARLQSKRTAKICYVICLGLLATTIAAGSRAAIVGLVVASIFVMAFSGRILMLLAIAALITFSLFFETVRSDIWIHFNRGESVKEAQSASGRDELYPLSLARIQRAGLLGEGFMSARIHQLEYSENQETTHAHNIYLDALMNLGLLGCLSVTLVLLSAGKMFLNLLIRSPSLSVETRRITVELTGMAIPLFMHCIADSGFVTSINAFTVLFLMVLALGQNVRRTRYGL